MKGLEGQARTFTSWRQWEGPEAAWSTSHLEKAVFNSSGHRVDGRAGDKSIPGRPEGVGPEAGDHGEKGSCTGLRALRMYKLQDIVIIQISMLQIRQETSPLRLPAITSNSPLCSCSAGGGT